MANDVGLSLGDICTLNTALCNQNLHHQQDEIPIFEKLVSELMITRLYNSNKDVLRMNKK